MAKSNAGRPRLSKDEKIKHGTLRTSREKAYDRAEMKVSPLAEYPPAPGGLSEDGERLWNAVVRELMDLEVLSSLDLFLLQALCIEWEAYLQHRREQLEIKSWYWQAGADGKSRTALPHPVHYNGTNHLKLVLKICNEFGLSPAARVRIGITVHEKKLSPAAIKLKSL